MSLENQVQRDIRLNAEGLLMRNNVGVLKDSRGIPVRFGLANDSSNLNKIFKSSDLVGVTPLIITPEMVGSFVGVFTAIETKKPGWKYTSSERELAQLKFIEEIKRLGGFAGFAQSLEDYRSVIHGN